MCSSMQFQILAIAALCSTHRDSYVDSKALRMQEVRIMLVGRWLRARGPCGSALQHKTCAQVTSPCEAIISRITPTPA